MRGEPGERGERGAPGAIGERGLPGDRASGARRARPVSPAQGAVASAAHRARSGPSVRSASAVSRARKASRGERGETGPIGLLPVVKLWQPDTVFYRGDVVAHDGGTFQAQRDTGQPPEHADWLCLAVAGRDGVTPEVRGTFAADGVYKRLDIVAFNGGSFIARRDNPGECPGPGWQLLTKQGRAATRAPRAIAATPALPGRAASAANPARRSPAGKSTATLSTRCR